MSATWGWICCCALVEVFVMLTDDSDGRELMNLLIFLFKSLLELLSHLLFLYLNTLKLTLHVNQFFLVLIALIGYFFFIWIYFFVFFVQRFTKRKLFPFHLFDDPHVLCFHSTTHLLTISFNFSYPPQQQLLLP